MKDNKLRELLNEIGIIKIDWSAFSTPIQKGNYYELKVLERKIDLILEHLNLDVQTGMTLKKKRSK